MYSYLAIIQARMGSERLPGKVMKELCSRPIIWHVIERLKLSKKIDRIVVAIPSGRCDDGLAAYLQKEGIDCFRGDENDVLDRFYKTSQRYPSHAVVRATADNPLLDPVILDETVDCFEQGQYRFVRTKGFPVGIGLEVFETELLEEAYRHARSAYEREHVTPYMYHTQKNHGEYLCSEDQSALRLTLDTEADFVFIRDIYAHLYKGAHDFTMRDIVKFLKSKAGFAGRGSKDGEAEAGLNERVV